MEPADRRRLAAVYLALQGALGLLWWAALLTLPAVRERFELLPDRRGGLDAFVFADAVVFIGGSALAAWTVWRRSTWAPTATAFAAGGTAYATLYLAGWVAFERSGAVGLVPMAAATVATSAIAVWVRTTSGGTDGIG